MFADAGTPTLLAAGALSAMFADAGTPTLLALGAPPAMFATRAFSLFGGRSGIHGLKVNLILSPINDEKKLVPVCPSPSALRAGLESNGLQTLGNFKCRHLDFQLNNSYKLLLVQQVRDFGQFPLRGAEPANAVQVGVRGGCVHHFQLPQPLLRAAQEIGRRLATSRFRGLDPLTLETVAHVTGAHGSAMSGALRGVVRAVVAVADAFHVRPPYVPRPCPPPAPDTGRRWRSRNISGTGGARGARGTAGRLLLL